MQRKEKLDAHSAENLPEEFADVIITTLLVAKSANINVKRALSEKAAKITARSN